MYTKLYTPDARQHIPMRNEEYSQLIVFGQLFTSLKFRSHKSAAIMAIWPGVTGNIINLNCTSKDIRVGLIEYFISHKPKISDASDQPHILAKVKWYISRPCIFAKISLKILLFYLQDYLTLTLRLVLFL